MIIFKGGIDGFFGDEKKRGRIPTSPLFHVLSFEDSMDTQIF
jgi:hypothetical protein